MTMKAYQKGIGGLQVLLLVGTVAAVSFVSAAKQEASADEDRLVVAEALQFADGSRRQIEDAFKAGNSLPRTPGEADAMKVDGAGMPDFVQDVKIQHDFAGETVMVMVYLNHGVVDNLLGGEQYVYFAGIKGGDGAAKLEWQCGARNVDLVLLPDHCRS